MKYKVIKVTDRLKSQDKKVVAESNYLFMAIMYALTFNAKIEING